MKMLTREQFEIERDRIESGIVDGVEFNSLLETTEDLQEDGIAWIKKRVIGGRIIVSGVPVFGWKEEEEEVAPQVGELIDEKIREYDLILQRRISAAILAFDARLPARIVSHQARRG